MIAGFKLGCRPLIGVDGCFLKGPYGGHLLSAVSIDSNGQMFPVVFVVVESETRGSWEWFVGEFQDVVEPYHDITFISHRQKGLVETFDSLMEGSDHKFCVRHLYDNFKLRDLNVEAYDWSTKVPTKLWARSSFTETSKNDILINNICESWNVVILEARDKPIIYMLEWIRRHRMLRFQCKKEWMHTQFGFLCPDIQKALNKVKQQATMCKVHYASKNKHVVACIFIKRDSLEAYVHPFYQRETYVKCYSGMIIPIPMEKLMKTGTIDPLLPPHYRKPIGRPKKARNKKNDDPKVTTKLSRSMVGLKCTKCKKNGHNSRTCKLPEPLIIDRPPPRREVDHQILEEGKQEDLLG
ncbi:uncharacterized protein LOC132314232 [Cornus florida]|uniref:uncharacterized protein LOC132314232 n=1 Tax=Cornus florida TaxID=4283 RepID=UPI0028A00343|nr:uncharacterized protein LOC132314232 [Cornus florida]